MKKYEFDSGNEGPNILFLGAVHGNETAGTNACNKIIIELKSNELKLKRGKVTFIPIVNQLAYEQQVRFIDVNLNRVINRYDNPINNETEIANQLAIEMPNYDIILDLHSTHCQGDVAFGFLDYPTANNQKIIEVLDVEYVLVGWPDLYKYQEDLGEYSTEAYAHKLGISGVTLECGYHKDKQAELVAEAAIINLLKSTSMLAGEIYALPNKCYIKMQEIVFKQKPGKLQKAYKHLDKLQKGEVIAVYDDGEKIITKEDCFILIPNHDAEVSFEWFYLGVEKKA